MTTPQTKNVALLSSTMAIRVPSTAQRFIIDEAEEQAVSDPGDDSASLFSTTTQASIARFTIPEEECQSCRSSRWTHVPHQFGSLTSKLLGKAAHAVVDPILDRQKKKFLQPVLDYARSLRTAEEWGREVAMRLSKEQHESTGRILEALR